MSALDRLRESRLLSLPRFVFAFGLMFLFGLLDWQVVGLLDITSFAEVVENTVIHGLGAYIGFTAVTLWEGS